MIGWGNFVFTRGNLDQGGGGAGLVSVIGWGNFVLNGGNLDRDPQLQLSENDSYFCLI